MNQPADPVEGRIRLPLMLALALLAAFAPIATDLYLPGFPDIAADLDATASGVQLTLTSFLVGLAFGQLVMGPLSDRYGRRSPLVISTAACVLAGVVTALTPDLAVLVVARLVQGFAGAGGMVIGRAVISDLVTGRAAAKAFTLMLTIGGVAPVLAPFVGSLLVGPVGWRGLLWTVTGLCVLMLLAVLAAVPETHPPEARERSAMSYPAAMRRALAASMYRIYLAVFALSFGTMMAYIASSPFVYQNVIGFSEVSYGLAFGVNAAGMITFGALAHRLVDVVEPRHLVQVCLAVQVSATLTFVVVAAAGAPGWTFAVLIFVAVVCQGGIMGSSAALAMSEVRDVAGTGSALLGFSQFALGALVSPLVGLAGEDSALAPAMVMATCSVVAGICAVVGPRRQPAHSSLSTSTATS